MLQDYKVAIDNNIIILSNMIMSRFYKLESKTLGYVDLPVEKSAINQPWYGVPYDYYKKLCSS